MGEQAKITLPTEPTIAELVGREIEIGTIDGKTVKGVLYIDLPDRYRVLVGNAAYDVYKVGITRVIIRPVNPSDKEFVAMMDKYRAEHVRANQLYNEALAKAKSQG